MLLTVWLLIDRKVRSSTCFFLSFIFFISFLKVVVVNRTNVIDWLITCLAVYHSHTRFCIPANIRRSTQWTEQLDTFTAQQNQINYITKSMNELKYHPFTLILVNFFSSFVLLDFHIFTFYPYYFSALKCTAKSNFKIYFPSTASGGISASLIS